MATLRRERRRENWSRSGAEVRGDQYGDTVLFIDGTEVPTNLVVVRIGSRPAIEWLDDSNIEVDNGVSCDEVGRASACKTFRAMLQARPGLWRLRCWGATRQQAWSSGISGATKHDVKIQMSGGCMPPILSIASRTTAANSWPITNATGYRLAWLVAGCRARS